MAIQIGPEQFLLSGLSGREGISQLFNFELDLLADNDRDIALDRLVGQSATVEIPMPDGTSRSFNGIASRVAQGMRGARLTSYRAEIVPRLWLLTRNERSRIFAHRNVPEIVMDVIAGFGEVESRLTESFPARDYCVQYRESDFDFASRLMEEEGIYYFFRHSAGGHTMVLADSPAGHLDVPGTRSVAFDPTGSSKDAAQSVFAWEKRQELRAGKVTLFDHNFELPDSHLEGRATIRDGVRVGQVAHMLRLGANANLELYDYPGGYAERFDGVAPGGGDQPGELQKLLPAAQQAATIRMDEEALPSITVSGSSNCRHFTGGHRFALSGHPNGNGAYVLTAVRHSVKVRDPLAGERGLRYENTFTCIPEALPFRPPRVTAKPTAPGTDTAFVIGPAGQEVFTDKYGRVKVQFHWDRQGKDTNTSRWIRVAQPVSRSGLGASWLPEIGDEVIVAFEHGDPDRPYILGAVYNPRRLPPPPRPPTAP